MRRWLPVGAPLVAGLLALGAAGIMSLSGQQAAMAQQGGVEDLAKRAIGGPGLSAAAVSLMPGQRASDMPLSLPTPGGSNVVGTVKRDLGPVTMWDVVIDAPATPPDVGAFFDQSLPGLGWNPAPAFGDVPAPQGVFCRGAEGPFVAVIAVPVSETASDVRVHVESGQPGPCSPPPAPPQQP
jgi:hypothetical protein